MSQTITTYFDKAKYYTTLALRSQYGSNTPVGKVVLKAIMALSDEYKIDVIQNNSHFFVCIRFRNENPDEEER
jgi:hypothetical protein